MFASVLLVESAARHWLPPNLPRKLLRPLKSVVLEARRGLAVGNFDFGKFARPVAEAD